LSISGKGVNLAYLVGKCLLLDLLNGANMTQRDLAIKLGVTEQQVNKYVRDRQRMSIQTAKNVAHILNCSMEDLYEWTVVGD